MANKNLETLEPICKAEIRWRSDIKNMHYDIQSNSSWKQHLYSILKLTTPSTLVVPRKNDCLVINLYIDTRGYKLHPSTITVFYSLLCLPLLQCPMWTPPASNNQDQSGETVVTPHPEEDESEAIEFWIRRSSRHQIGLTLSQFSRSNQWAISSRKAPRNRIGFWERKPLEMAMFISLVNSFAAGTALAKEIHFSASRCNVLTDK